MIDSPMPWRILRAALTESTNDDAKRAAEADEAEGLVVWALRQTAGKGRHGRTWESPEGNLYCSVLLRPDCSMQAVGHYSFVAAPAVHDVVKAFLPQAEIKLKWPNDVLVGGKKIAGILLESAPAPDNKIEWLIIGIGLNVLHHPDNTLYPATSLREEGARQIELPDILDQLLTRLGHWRDVLENQGFEPILAAWWACAQKGKLSVRLPKGTLEGVFAGIDQNGSLRLRLADGSEQAIATGDVWIRD